MVNYINSLSRKYDKEIRKSCEIHEKIINQCLKDNFNDEFTCKLHIDDFNNCIKVFNENFKKKFFAQ